MRCSPGNIAHPDALQGGGAVVSVRADTGAEQTHVDDAMASAGFARRTGWGALATL